ncbi:hypothetical protein GF325_03160 [Candidatus Bathyarchaeota archaeon]|nr:hypothetical protein [Candidatus Bathyarchaeota archaeon]
MTDNTAATRNANPETPACHDGQAVSGLDGRNYKEILKEVASSLRSRKTSILKEIDKFNWLPKEDGEKFKHIFAFHHDLLLQEKELLMGVMDTFVELVEKIRKMLDDHKRDTGKHGEIQLWDKTFAPDSAGEEYRTISVKLRADGLHETRIHFLYNESNHAEPISVHASHFEIIPVNEFLSRLRPDFEKLANLTFTLMKVYRKFKESNVENGNDELTYIF